MLHIYLFIYMKLTPDFMSRGEGFPPSTGWQCISWCSLGRCWPCLPQRHIADSCSTWGPHQILFWKAPSQLNGPQHILVPYHCTSHFSLLNSMIFLSVCDQRNYQDLIYKCHHRGKMSPNWSCAHRDVSPYFYFNLYFYMYRQLNAKKDSDDDG